MLSSVCRGRGAASRSSALWRGAVARHQEKAGEGSRQGSRGGEAATPTQGSSRSMSSNLLTPVGGVHATAESKKKWKNAPLFFEEKAKLMTKDGEGRFRTGQEAAEMLMGAATFMDPDEREYLETTEDIMNSLEPVFDREPRAAWVAKQLLEPERALTFRVSWLDDNGVARVQRGYRVQYNSAVGPYEGPLLFGPDVTFSNVKAQALDCVLMNSLAGTKKGGAAGGADFDASTKSEPEIQRFLQSYMTELYKYIGDSTDLPTMGYGCGLPEMGYLYGQFKRLSETSTPAGEGFLYGGLPPHPEAAGFGCVYYADAMLKAKGDSLEGKKCIITGSGKNAMHICEKLLQFGAIPLTLSDRSGHIYEPGGIDLSKFRTLQKIKSERGAPLGRYLIASPTTKFNEPEGIFNIPCDMVFLAATDGELTDRATTVLADHGCKAIVDGAWRPVTPGAIKVIKKRGLLHAPYRATLLGGTIANSLGHLPDEEVDAALQAAMQTAYKVSSKAAAEYNARGYLGVGAVVAGFARISKSMTAHGAI